MPKSVVQSVVISALLNRIPATILPSESSSRQFVWEFNSCSVSSAKRFFLTSVRFVISHVQPGVCFGVHLHSGEWHVRV